MLDAVKIAKGRQEEIAAENRRLSDFLAMADKLVKDGCLEADADARANAGASAGDGPARQVVTGKVIREPAAREPAAREAVNGDRKSTLFARRVEGKPEDETLSLRN